MQLYALFSTDFALHFRVTPMYFNTSKRHINETTATKPSKAIRKINPSCSCLKFKLIFVVGSSVYLEFNEPSEYNRRTVGCVFWLRNHNS